MKSSKPERAAAEAAKTQTRQSLLAQYDQLKQYATSIDFDASPVRIRLEDARKAADAVNELKFVQLARSISETLDERFNRITAARNIAPKFSSSLPMVAPAESGSSQGPSDSSATQSSSQDILGDYETVET